MKVTGKIKVRSCTDWLNVNERNSEAVFKGPSASCPSPVAPGSLGSQSRWLRCRYRNDRTAPPTWPSTHRVSTCPLRPPASRANHPLPGRAAPPADQPRAGGVETAGTSTECRPQRIRKSSTMSGVASSTTVAPVPSGSTAYIPAMSALGVRRAKAASSQWVQIPPGNFAPAGSNRSSHGGNEVAEASDVTDHLG
jgi:hypothetical protein